MDELKVWVGGCSHVEADKEKGRDSIAEAISQIEETRLFDPDIAFLLGDFSSSLKAVELDNYAAEGLEVSAQLSSGKYLTRNRIYCTTGNHDAGRGNYDWYNRYVDDFGKNPFYSGVYAPLRPYPLTGVENSHYKIETGNIVWLVLYDQNDGPGPCGRGDKPGGFPSGSVLESAFEWWRSEVEAAHTAGKNVITLCHYLLKNTTLATGDYEGVQGKFHGGGGQPIGSGRLHNLIIDKVANVFEEDQSAFSDFLEANPGKNSLWLGTHTHYQVGEEFAGRTWTKKDSGCVFVNVGSLGRNHTSKNKPDAQSVAMFFRKDQNKVTIRKIIHNSNYTGNRFLDTYDIEAALSFPIVL
jgi:hypothetical protein